MHSTVYGCYSRWHVLDGMEEIGDGDNDHRNSHKLGYVNQQSALFNPFAQITFGQEDSDDPYRTHHPNGPAVYGPQLPGVELHKEYIFNEVGANEPDRPKGERAEHKPDKIHKQMLQNCVLLPTI